MVRGAILTFLIPVLVTGIQRDQVLGRKRLFQPKICFILHAEARIPAVRTEMR